MPIDAITFDFECLLHDAEYTSRPADGAYVRGMFVEGARWNTSSMLLDESEPKVCLHRSRLKLLFGTITGGHLRLSDSYVVIDTLWYV